MTCEYQQPNERIPAERRRFTVPYDVLVFAVCSKTWALPLHVQAGHVAQLRLGLGRESRPPACRWAPLSMTLGCQVRTSVAHEGRCCWWSCG